MNIKKFFLLLLFVFQVIFITPVYAGTLPNSGFIPGQIWYSEDKLVEGDTVNIHTAVWNGGDISLSVKVEFYDKNVILGNREVVLNALELKDVYISWKVTSGDHVISAKIISSEGTVSNKKEKIVLNRIATSNDKQFVSVSVKNNLGESVLVANVLGDKINKTLPEINNIIPEKVSDTVSSNLGVVDDFRNSALAQAETAKNESQKEVDQIKSEEKTIEHVSNTNSSVEEIVKKPIAYMKLFFFSVLAFIFGNKIVFYGVIVIVVFCILRFIIRKIRNK
jgi:hypothetical protein